MKPFGRTHWVLGKHQNDPEVAKLNRRLRSLSTFTKLHCAFQAALFLVALSLYPPDQELYWISPLVVLGYGIRHARYLRRRSHDLEATQDSLLVGTNLSRAERTEADYNSIIVGVFVNVLPYVVLYWWLSEGRF